MSKNRYYEKHFVKTDTLLSTDYFYRITDTMNVDGKNAHNYLNRAFLFYPNGLVLEENYYTDKPDRDTLYTYTDDLKFARCHGWTVGSLKTTSGYLRRKYEIKKTIQMKVFLNGPARWLLRISDYGNNEGLDLT